MGTICRIFLVLSILTFAFDHEAKGAVLTANYAPACSKTNHPQFCAQSFANSSHALNLNDPLVVSALKMAFQTVNQLESNAFNLYKSIWIPANRSGFKDCVMLQQDAADLLSRSVNLLTQNPNGVSKSQVYDLQSWVSAALTYQTTCSDGIAGDAMGSSLINAIVNASKMLSISLSFITSTTSPGIPFRSRTGHDSFLTSTEAKPSSNIWSQQLLQYYSFDSPDAVVAQDGTGKYSTISDAVASAPNQSSTIYLIYIKAGIYKENVEVPKEKTNLAFVGDGIDQTIITGSKSVQDPGVTTFTSATVIIKGDGFLGRDLTIQNTAGAINHQAVALRVSADNVAFFRCSFEGYQDTLYAHSLRQFYRECNIYGTVDFIFGNAAAVFESCTLIGRLPLSNQQVLYTAQGRTDPNQNTGFSFQGCTIDAVQQLRNLKNQINTYLGRPWKNYARVVYSNCFESAVLNPAGWYPWNGDFALSTLFFAEYNCFGPGYQPASRVSWSTQLSPDSAKNYTASYFIDAASWLPRTGFPLDLLKTSSCI